MMMMMLTTLLDIGATYIGSVTLRGGGIKAYNIIMMSFSKKELIFGGVT